MSRWLRHHVVDEIPGHVVGWIIGGAIVALSGVSPDDWIAHLVHSTSELLPKDWSAGTSALVVRSSFAALGVAVIASTLVMTRRPKEQPAHAADAGDPTSLSVTAPPTLKPSIAVLPFQNLSGDPEQDYFCDGMVEDITTALSRFSWLFVIARNSSFTYKGKLVDVKTVGRELGVRYVLEGSVRKDGDRVRITGQLIDVATNAHLWADKFDRPLENVFALQDAITERVVGALAPSLNKAELERTRRQPPANLNAYDYLLRAMPYVTANTPDATGEAIRLLTEALRLDPDYPYAHAMLANSYGQIFRSAVGQERAEAQKAAVEHARRAVAIGGDDGAALAYAGWILLIAAPDVGGGRAALDKATQLNPNLAIALAYRSIALALTGEPTEAIEDATKALRLSPIDPSGYLAHCGIAIAKIALDEFDEAATAACKSIEMNPRFPMSYAWLIVAECGRGDKAQAESRLRQLREILPSLTADGLPGLFGYFPPEIREKALNIMRSQGVIANRLMPSGRAGP